MTFTQVSLRLLQKISFMGIKVLSEVPPRQALLDFVVKHNGMIDLSKTLFRNSWQIQKIRAVYFNEEFDIEQEDDVNSKKWNAYVDRIRTAIGVDSYFELVLNKVGNIVGIMSFYNPKGDEIKVKHFDKWGQLWQKISHELSSTTEICRIQTRKAQGI